jgi:RimJ/RimL family protein N-acetyltransferase
MPFGWEGKLTRLVPLDKEKHLENAYRWLNDPEVTQWLLIGDMPLTMAAEEAYFEAHSKPNDTEVAFAIETLDGRHLGFSGIHRIDHRHGTAMTGTVLGAKDMWGKGFGTDAAIVRARYCFEVLGLRLLTSSVLVGNERSLRMQLRAGYKQCGLIPKRFWKRGAYRDEMLTYMLPDSARTPGIL